MGYLIGYRSFTLKNEKIKRAVKLVVIFALGVILGMLFREVLL